MIRIKLLLSSLLVFASAVLADSAWAASESEPASMLWPCGASLLPCRLPRATAVTSLPYWRIDQPNRPIRASYTPAFSNRKTR